MLSVNEIFGPTIQGEGSAAGQHCLFVRLFGCNLECSWCDTPYTWAVTPAKAAKTESGKQYDIESERHQMSTGDIITRLRELWNIDERPTIIVISGGEPLMQQIHLVDLVRTLSLRSHKIHIETAGTIAPTADLDRWVDQYNVSPKLEHSGNRGSKRIKSDVLRSFRYTGRAWFKFVVKNVRDLNEVDALVNLYEIPRNRVMIMPEGTDPVKLLLAAQGLANEVVKRGYGLTQRTHILTWGDKRGV